MPVAILKPVADAPRTVSEIIAAMEAGRTRGLVDEDIARDVERGIESRGQPCNPTAVFDASSLLWVGALSALTSSAVFRQRLLRVEVLLIRRNPV